MYDPGIRSSCLRESYTSSLRSPCFSGNHTMFPPHFQGRQKMHESYRSVSGTKAAIPPGLQVGPRSAAGQSACVSPRIDPLAISASIAHTNLGPASYRRGPQVISGLCKTAWTSQSAGPVNSERHSAVIARDARKRGRRCRAAQPHTSGWSCLRRRSSST
jgi:hypothetical protein